MKRVLLASVAVLVLSFAPLSLQAGTVWYNTTTDNMWNTIANWGANPVNAVAIFNSGSPAGTVYVNADISHKRLRQNFGAPVRLVTIADTNLNDATLTFTGTDAELIDANLATADWTFDGGPNTNGASLKLAIGGNKPTPIGSDITFNLLLDISGGGHLRLATGNDGAGTNATINLGGINTYSGNTRVAAQQTINLLDDARLTFYIGSNGVNNLVGYEATTGGNVNLDGDFAFDLTGAEILNGNQWNIVDVANLTETYGATFQVLGGFTQNSDVWTYVDGLNTWTFTEATGVLDLAVVPEPSTILLGLLGGLGLLVVLQRRRSA